MVTGRPVRRRTSSSACVALRTGGRRPHPRTAGVELLGARRRRKGSGVCLVDIGGGTTDIAVFTGGSIRHTVVIPIAGDQVTNDIAGRCARRPNMPTTSLKYACALTQLASPDETIEVPSIGDRPPRRLSRQTLAEVVEPRYEELLTPDPGRAASPGYEDLVAGGVVLTGGSAKMEGLIDLAEEVFTCRYGWAFPSTTGLDVVRNPIHATGGAFVVWPS